MLTVSIFYCGALVLCWTPSCEAQHVSHGQELIKDPTGPGDLHTVSPTETGDGLKMKNAPKQSSSASTVSHHIPHHAPCLVNDMITSLREGVGNAGELTNSSLTLFGICASLDNLSSSVLLEVAQETRRNGFKIVYPTEVRVAEEDESRLIDMTFDFPRRPLLKKKPMLFLMFDNPPGGGGDLDVTFTSRSLHPDTQSVCISGETRYVLLTGKESQINSQQKWMISAETKSPDMKQTLKDTLIGGKSGNGKRMTPLLLFSGYPHVSDSSPVTSQTSFLCELKCLLGDLLPHDKPESPPFQLESLQSLPPLTIGLSSSETLLAGLMNSSAPTVFSFTGWRSTLPVHRGELSLSPALLEELRQRLQQTVTQIQDIIREEDIGHRATERLKRLKDLVVFPQKEPATGESQYRGFLLLKALQTVARANELQRGLRAARADPKDPVGGDICALRSLTVSLERHVVGPDTANINNCHGSCRFPLANAINHAVLLDFRIRNGDADVRDERAPCCVPLAYEALEVVDFNEHGTYLSIKPDMVAKECGCR